MTEAEATAKSAELLDEFFPQWWTRINLATLNIDHPCRCVLGQLGQAHLSTSAAEGFLALHNRISEIARSRGDLSLLSPFDTTWVDEEGFAHRWGMTTLNTAWRYEILKRFPDWIAPVAAD